ncbi:transposase InsO family protein [Olsenella profusa DSM 13989]|uniref:DDE-type integrase/transposase/recombinase n=1 Tax=Olsenella profusa TaxID=138595 RepID=UPI002787CCFE|nr:DDE-type integrase/transposase/recombinase [Olsenella profusa]MDP9859149.1 transposase InsO family protein [Olsenella profusa DSM 13989]
MEARWAAGADGDGEERPWVRVSRLGAPGKRGARRGGSAGHSSYQGEASEAPDNLLRDGRGRRHLRAGRPNGPWIADVTELRIPAGKAYPSPIIDCFGGMLMSWAMSASPDAGMANTSLLGACAQLKGGGRPKGHADRGCHYRWPGWIEARNDYGIVRSMPGEGCGPDNARAEGSSGGSR